MSIKYPWPLTTIPFRKYTPTYHPEMSAKISWHMKIFLKSHDSIYDFKSFPRSVTLNLAHVDSNWIPFIKVISHARRGVSVHRWLQCLLNSLFGLTPKKQSKLGITGPSSGQSTDGRWKGPVMRRVFLCHDVLMYRIRVVTLRVYTPFIIIKTASQRPQ